MNKFLFILTFLYLSFSGYGQQITVTIGYPDNENHFLYSIPPNDEHARFGGEYYFKVENTGTVDLVNFEIITFWKSLNNTWGVVQKTVLNSATGEIKLTGPSWDSDLDVGESFVLNGEWVPSASIEDWIEFLPRNLTMTAGGNSVSVVYDVQGEINLSNYAVQKVMPFSDDRKTYTNLKTVAYFPIFDADNAWCSLQRYGANIDQLRVQLYSIDPNGTLRAGQDLPAAIDPIVNIDYWLDYIDSIGVIDYCEANGIEFIPVVYNYNNTINDFDQMAVNTMMTNATIRATHLNDLEQLLISHSEFDGIDIDYESLMGSDRDNYSLFMEDLASIVHSHGKLLTTAVHTKVGPGTWYGPLAQDYQRLGNAVDEILLMTYDLHWATSPTYNNPPPTAGCQSTSDWMNDVACFAISEIEDPSKIQLGLPFYGYRWKHLFENHTLADAGVGLTAKDAQELIDNYSIPASAINRDPNGNEPNFLVSINNTNWICYYQDGPSLDTKLEALDKYNLRDYIGGVGIWRLGNETDEMWEAITQSLHNTPAIINSSIDCSSGTNTSSLNQIKHEEMILYPNPASEYLNIHRSESSQIEISLVGIDGSLIYEFGSFTSNLIAIDLTKVSVSNGFYLLKVESTEGEIDMIQISIHK